MNSYTASNGVGLTDEQRDDIAQNSLDAGQMLDSAFALGVQAAAPHLRAGMADELLDDTPGSPLTRGYQRLMDPKTGEHPVRTWEAAVRVMLDTLLEGGGEDK